MEYDFGTTYEEHSTEVRELLRKADMSMRSMLTSRQVYNAYALLDGDEWEFMSPNTLRDNIMHGDVAINIEDPDEYEAVALAKGTGLVCPGCGGKVLVNWDMLDDKELVVCPYCDKASTLPEEPE